MLFFKKHYLRLGFGIFLIIFAFKMMSSIFYPQKRTRELIVPMAEVAEVIEDTVPYSIVVPGTFMTPQSINVHNRISGNIIGIHFQEGQIVKENDLLYTLDVESYKAQLHQAEGILERDLALLEDAHRELARNETMLKKNVISQSQFDQVKSTAKSLEASIKSDQANIDLIKLQISYGEIKSPITGRIGFTSVNVGNLIQVSDVSLTTILKINPLQFLFSLSEKYLKYFIKQDLSSFKIALLNEEHQEKQLKGKLIAVDNAINSNTGSIQLKAEFDNSQFDLLPGQFFNMKINLEDKKNVLIVPISAIQTGPNGYYVVVYDSSTSSVSVVSIKLGLTSNFWAIIESGVKKGDLVILSGQNRFKTGTCVEKIIRKETRELIQEKK